MTERARIIEIVFVMTIAMTMLILIVSRLPREVRKSSVVLEDMQVSSISATPSPSPSASPSPTVRPLTFSEMNSLYGPCTRLPVLMYHHIEDKEKALKNGYASLTVDTVAFRKHLEYLRNNQYSFVAPSDLINYFDNGSPLPSKPVMITFDDGYMDNYTVAYPIMKELGVKGIIFIATGLMNNPGYLSWDNILEMQGSGLLSFGNHTWSHMNVGAKKEIVDKEITTADTQLKERGLNSVKTFAYPYGLENGFAHGLLEEQGYKLGFTTKYGIVMCSKQRLSLPRVRVGDSSLDSYGL